MGIVRVTYGPQLHKLCTVVNIVDAGRLLVEGPENLTGVPRQILPVKRVSLTGLEVNITRDARQKQLNKAWADSGIQKAWDASAYAKTLKRRETPGPDGLRPLQAHDRQEGEARADDL